MSNENSYYHSQSFKINIKTNWNMQALVKNDLLRACLTYSLKWLFTCGYNSNGRDLVPTSKLKQEKET